MKKSICILLSLLVSMCAFTSCRSTVQHQPPAAETTTVAATQMTTAESEATDDKENIKETPYGPAYEADLQEYGELIAAKFYQCKNGGNPDWYQDCILYDHTTDILISPYQEIYHLPQKNSVWACRITQIPEELVIVRYTRHMNLDKYSDGVWVRQAVLDRKIWESEESINDRYITQEMLREALLGSSIDFDPSLVYPQITPGQYRFLFYITVQVGETTENRAYTIPFTVVE